MTFACPSCGTGARRIDPVKLPNSKLPKRPARTYTWQLILPPRIVSGLKTLAPQCLRPVVDHTDQLTEYAELIGEKTLPPWRSESTGWCRDEKTAPPCPQCGRDGHYFAPGQLPKLCYDKADDGFAVAETYECFGRSWMRPELKRCVFASPALVINAEVAVLFERERGIELVEVTFL